MGRHAICSRTRLKLTPIYQLQTASSQLQTASRQLAFAACLLLTAFCQLLTVSGCASRSDEHLSNPQSATHNPQSESPSTPWPDPSTPEGKFAGRYWLSRGSGADQQTVSTVLQPNMVCLLSIEFRGIKRPTLAFRGTWSAEKDTATCKFTECSGTPILTSVVYKFEGRNMVSIQWDEPTFGPQPLKFQKASGGAMQMN